MNITEVSISLSEIFATIFAIIATALGYLVKEGRDKIKNLQSQLADKKYKLYHEILTFFFDVFKAQKKLNNVSDNDLVSKLIDIKEDLIIYAPDEIVRKVIEWDTTRSTYANDPRHLSKFLELFVLIRKDMGHTKTTMIPEDVLKFIMVNEEEFKEAQKLIFKK